MATWVEDNESRSATFHRLGKRATSTYTKSYKVFGHQSDVDLQLEAEAKIRNELLFFQYPGSNVQLFAESYSINYLGDDAWQVTIAYEKEGADDDSQTEPLKRGRSFDTSGGTQHITQSRPVGNGAALDFERRFPQNAANQSGAIGVDGDSVAGVDVVVPSLQWTETYDVPSDYVTSAYIKSVANLTGTTNRSTFRTFAAGEVLFLGCNGSQEWDDNRGDGPWSLSYKFVASPNAGPGQTYPAMTVGNIAGIEKQGHEYLWIKYEPSVNGTSLVKLPKAVYVNKVYRDADFSLLGIGVA